MTNNNQPAGNDIHDLLLREISNRLQRIAHTGVPLSGNVVQAVRNQVLMEAHIRFVNVPNMD